MWNRFLAWTNRPVENRGPLARSRNQVQHLAVFLTVVIAGPYAGLLWVAEHQTAAVIAGLVAAGSVGILFSVTRRGRLERGGVAVSLTFLLGIAVVLVSRGGLQSNSAIWLVMVPVLAVMMAGPQYSLPSASLVCLLTAGLWGAQTAGVAFPPSLPAHIAWLMVLLDHVTVPLSVAALLWSQANVWKRVVVRLDDANDSLRDEVAERKRAEQRALEAARARSTFLATMSHEIRTPLNGVLGLTEAMLHGTLSQEQRQLATTVQESGNLLRTLLDDVLDFSKIESGKLEIVQRRVNLRALTHELMILWRPRAVERGLTLHVDVAEVLPKWITIDDHRLRQILGNLLSNAIKFTEIGTVGLTARKNKERLQFVVSDTGCGISSSDLKRALEPFQQVDSSDSRQHGGTGLGLAICQRLVLLLDGTLTATSTVGEGARFSVDLPLVVASPAPHPVAPNKGTVLAGRRVLAAEDNPINQVVLRKLLTRAGATLRLASDGYICQEMCEEALPEIILMDCQMPGCDGYSATKALRGRGVTIPIIAVTASTMPGDRKRCIDAGMNDYLSKPVKADELEAILVKWLTQDEPDRASSIRSDVAQ